MSSRLTIWSRALTSVNKVPQRNPRTPSSDARPPEPAPQVKVPDPTPEPTPDHLSVYTTSEAWPRRFKDKPTQKETRESANPPGRPRMKPEQRRRNTISIAMSEEEEAAIRHAAAERGVSISEWARVAMFKHMGRQVPKRDDRRRDWSKVTGED